MTLGHIDDLERPWNMSNLVILKGISHVRGCLEKNSPMTI